MIFDVPRRDLGVPGAMCKSAFSSEIAGCDASRVEYRVREGVNTCDEVVLEIEHPNQLGLLHQGTQRTDRARLWQMYSFCSTNGFCGAKQVGQGSTLFRVPSFITVV